LLCNRPSSIERKQKIPEPRAKRQLQYITTTVQSPVSANSTAQATSIISSLHPIYTDKPMSNPGTELSKAVEAEAIRFREIQDEIQKLRADQQTLLSQQSENEMVKQELNFLSDGDQVYKMIRPTLMKNDTEDAKQTVEQRLTMITGEL